MAIDDPLTWPHHRAYRAATFDPEQRRLGFERSLYRDDCSRAVACAGCGRLLPDPATSFIGPDGAGVAQAWCSRCSGGDGADQNVPARARSVHVCAECGRRYEGDGHWCSVKDNTDE
jgi:hypothetical protein